MGWTESSVDSLNVYNHTIQQACYAIPRSFNVLCVATVWRPGPCSVLYVKTEPATLTVRRSRILSPYS